jgi:hypothetical protein
MSENTCFAMFIAHYTNARIPEFIGVAATLQTAKELCAGGEPFEWENDTRTVGRYYSELKPHQDYFIIQEVQVNTLQSNLMEGA